MLEARVKGWKRTLGAAACMIAAFLGSPAARGEYQVTFNVSLPLSEVHVSAHEFNGSVYAWDLFPMWLGNVPAGQSTFSLGNHNVVSWAIFGVAGTSSMATGINDSLSHLPVGQTFAATFPGYALSTVRYNAATLSPGGIYNTQQGYSMFDFVLTNEDTLKTDLATGTLHMFVFDNGVNIGTATISVAVPHACCSPEGTCTITTQAACTGTWLGTAAGLTCSPSPCPQPPSGSCCAADGTCSVTVAVVCADVWTQGAVCQPNPCQSPAIGACCTGTACTEVAFTNCVGSYQGDFTACGAPGNPTTCCAANFNGVGGLSVQDIFDYLNAWFAGNLAADMNGDGALAVQDIFDYLNAWFAGCG